MRKLTRWQTDFKGLTVGLDVHKRFIEYCVLDAAGDECGAGRVMAFRDNLLDFAHKLDRPAQFALEACSSFFWVHQALAETCGPDRVYVAQPSRIAAIANSGEKDDANDAWWLAYLLFDRRLPTAYVAQGDLLQLRLATRELRSVTDRRADLIRRFRSHLLQCGIKMTGSSFNTLSSRFKAGEIVREQLYGMRQQACKKIMKGIDYLDGEVEGWRKKVIDLSASTQEVQWITRQLPGFGPILAATLWAELGDPRRYRSAKAYAKASGLTPTKHNTCGRPIHGPISKAGSAHARWALTRAIIGAMRCKKQPGATIKWWILNQRKRKPMAKVVAAGGRKMAEAVWRLFAFGERFDVAKGFGG